MRNIHVIMVLCLVCWLACSRRPLQPQRSLSDAAGDTDGLSDAPASDRNPSRDALGSDIDAATPRDADIIYSDGPVSESSIADSTGDTSDADGDGPRRQYHAIAVATGLGHTCALLDDHQVKCWGKNGSGQLGYGDTVDRGSTPEQMGDALPTLDLGAGRSATKIAAGWYATCAILDDGTLKCWGAAGANGQIPARLIGDAPGEMGDNLVPLNFGGRKVVNVAIDGRGFTACASMDDDTIWCWGSGQGPTMVVGLPIAPVRAISGGNAVVALYENGTVSPSLPLGTSPVFMSSHKVLAISGSANGSTCALLDDGTIGCGDGPSIINPPGEVTALGIEQNSNSICALFADGSIRCPADNPGGNCGAAVFHSGLPGGTYWCNPNGTIALGQAATAITSDGHDYMCALLADGQIKCWGGPPGGPPWPWLGSGIAYTTQSDGSISFGAWHTVDLGTHP
jgi:hypothetical protein